MRNLWAITSYFNYSGQTTRRENYYTFRKQLTPPLLTVELACDGAFELKAGDAEILIQLSTDHLLWQKERLLNLALDHLPDSCLYVAWIDADLIFERNDWPKAAIEELETFRLVQLFREVIHLPRRATSTSQSQETAIYRTHSFGSAVRDGCLEVSGVHVGEDKMDDEYSPGHAWVAKRETIEAIRFFDVQILGGADHSLALAAIDRGDLIIARHKMSAALARSYLVWKQRCAQTVEGKVGCIDGRIFHLWHGHLEDRRYGSRHRILRAFSFDPASDIALDDSRLWRWASEKPAMHEAVRAFFLDRRKEE